MLTLATGCRHLKDLNARSSWQNHSSTRAAIGQISLEEIGTALPLPARCIPSHRINQNDRLDNLYADTA